MTDFDRAYRENAELVYRYVFSLTRNADLAEEVTQQTFYEAIRHPGNYRGEAALSTYLCGIAGNLMKKELSRRARENHVPPYPRPAGKDPGGGVSPTFRGTALFGDRGDLRGERDLGESDLLPGKAEIVGRRRCVMLPCHIVRDLLPSYLEHLTGPETEADICEHLESCPDCRAARDAMAADLKAEKAPPPKLNFLKRLRWQQRLGAVLSVAATLLCLVGLYRLEYCYDLTDTAEMKEIIREDLVSISGFPYHGEVDVLETATVKDRMFVLYRLEQNGTFERQGIYQFQRGLFGGYRFRSREYDTCPIVNTSLIQIGRQRYLEIYTANWPKEAASFRVFPGYRPPAYDGEEEILPDISTLAPVYEGTAAKSILQVIPVTEEQVKAGFFGSMSVAYYDAEGSQLDTGELIKLYRNSEGGSGGGGGGNGAIWPVDVFQVILVILGIIMTRYFLCPEPKKERKDHL